MRANTLVMGWRTVGVLGFTACVVIGAPVAAALQGGFGMIDPPAPPPLPSPPVFDRFVLENPWPLAVLLALGAVGAFITLRHRPPARRAFLISGGLLAAGAGVVLAGALVETPRERLRSATLALVSAAARADAEGTGELLAPDAVLYPPGGGSALDRDRVMARVREDLGGRWRLREWAVLETQSAASGDSGRTQVKVRVTPESVGFPNISWWRIGWRRDGAGWRVISIEPVSVTAEVERELR